MSGLTALKRLECRGNLNALEPLNTGTAEFDLKCSADQPLPGRIERAGNLDRGVNQPAQIVEQYWLPPGRAPVKRILFWAAILAALVVCWRAAEIRPTAFFEPGAAASVWAFLRGLFPPDLSPAFLRVVAAAIVETLAIAIAGTVLSIFIAIPLGMLATPTLWRRGVLVAGEHRGPGQLGLAIASHATKALLGFLRAVPELVWALLFVVAVGLGSLAGALALAVSYSGVLGRVYADVFEDVEPRALEALQATGANRLQIFIWAVLPQAAPSITAYTLYSFECCVRGAAVLGFVGAGGIGYEINISMRLFEYGQVLTLITALVCLVAATEMASRFIRRRLHANAPAGSLAHNHLNNLNLASARERIETQLKKYSRTLAAAFLIIGSFYLAGFFNGSLVDASLLRRSARFVGRMFPPDFDPEFLRSLARPLLQTIGISVMGTLLGIAIGASFAVPATSTLVFVDQAETGKPSAVEKTAQRLVFYSARLALNVLRSIPELIWVMVCVLAVGLGPFAGTLAIGLHTGGVLGKLYAETLEEVPARPIEALRAAGARSMQILFWGIWPQARPALASYTVLRWDFNLRVSTVLGLVGGGGLGQAIYNNVQLGFYQRVATLIALIYIMVIAADWLGTRLRARRVAL